MKSSPTSATGLWPLLERSSSVRMLVVLEPFLADFARSPDDFRTCLPLSSLMELRVFVENAEAARPARFLRMRRPSLTLLALSNDMLVDRKLR